MTITLHTTAAPVAAAAQAHHAELRARLTQRSEALLAAVASRAPHEVAQRELVAFLHAELLPHTEVEETLLYAAARTEATALLVRAIADEHRMLTALIDELDEATDGMDAAVAAGALVVLCTVRIEQEDRHLLPALATAGVDLTTLLTDRPEIVGDTLGTTP